MGPDGHEGHPAFEENEEIALVELTTRELVPFRRAVNVRPGRYGQELTAMLDLPDPVEDASARWWDGRHRISDLFPGPPAARAPLRAVFFLAGFVIAASLAYGKFVHLEYRMTERPLFYFGLLAMILGTQLFVAGFLGEMISRNSHDRNNYLIEKKVNL